MKEFSRFAIYWRPDPGPLADFGARWLGWDPATGQEAEHPNVPLDVAGITATPRKYGLHGTIKPPMRLADGYDPDDLIPALDALAAKLAPVQMPGLVLSRLGGFLALVPEGDSAPLATLAGQVVRALDPFRAPAGQAELTRRRAAGLTPAQEQNLTRWGYPYVMEEFRFHVTLTGRLTEDDARVAQAVLAPMLALIKLRPFRVGALTLLGEDGAGRFHDLHTAPLLG